MDVEKNTKFFHLKVSQRKKRNWIHIIKDASGKINSEPERIENIFVDHFKDLFQSYPTQNIDEAVEMFKDRITQPIKVWLLVSAMQSGFVLPPTPIVSHLIDMSLL